MWCEKAQICLYRNLYEKIILINYTFIQGVSIKRPSNKLKATNECKNWTKHTIDNKENIVPKRIKWKWLHRKTQLMKIKPIIVIYLFNSDFSFEFKC